MNGVGTDIGRAWEQQQGTGTSTTVDMPLTKQALLYEQAEKRAAAAEKAATIKAAMGKLGSVKPDWWHKHDQYLRDKFAEVQKKGIDIIASGKDPFVDIDFVKEWEGFQADANISKDQKARFDTWNNEMSKALPQEYTDESIVSKNNYFNMDIPTLRQSGITEPPLAKNSTLDLQAYIGKLADAAAADQKDVTSEQWDQKFQATWSNPEVKQQISQAYDRVFQAYPPEMKALIDEAFAGNRMKYYEGLAQNAFDIRRPETDFNVTELVSKTAGIVGDVFTSYENDMGVTTSSKNKNSLKLAKAQAEVVFQGQKNKYRQFVDQMNIAAPEAYTEVNKFVEEKRKAGGVKEENGIESFANPEDQKKYEELMTKADEAADATIYKKAVDLFGKMVYDALPKSQQTSRVGNLGGGSGDASANARDWLVKVRAGDYQAGSELAGLKWGKYLIERADTDPDGKHIRIYYKDEFGELKSDYLQPDLTNDGNRLLEVYSRRKGDIESESGQSAPTIPQIVKGILNTN